jgi:hypothetical protein
MAHLWMQERVNEWVVVPLEDDPLALDGVPPRRLQASRAADEARSGAFLMPLEQEGMERWAVVDNGGRARINGQPTAAGLRLLEDRDEIRTAAGAMAFFSTETRARIEPFPGAERPVHCPRCKLEIEPGTPAVNCPRCSIWHHESKRYPCWTYAERCSLCDQETALDAGFRFTPEDL